MKFFIDTANLDQIKEANDLGILDGVTTNPSLMAKEGIRGEENITKLYKTISDLVKGDVSAEVISTDFDGIIAEGKKLAKINSNIIVKVPMIKAGAKYVSPFIGRIDDSSWDGIELIAQIANIYAIQGYQTEILAASIRSSLHIVRCAEAGANVITSPLEPILGLLKHPLTDIGLAKFLADAKGAK